MGLLGVKLQSLCVHAKLLQSGLTPCNPVDYSTAGSFVHRDSSGKNARVGCHALPQGIFLIQGWNHISYVFCFGW